LVSAYPDARFFADESGSFTVTSNPAFRESFALVRTLIDSGAVNKIDDWSSDWQPAIADNKIASFLLANWLKFFLPTFAPTQAGLWNVALWPQFSPMADQRYGSEAGGSVFVVMKRSANAQAAADYLRQAFFEKAGALAAYNAIVLALSEKPQKPEGMSDADFALQPGNYFGPAFARTELESYDYVKVLQYDPSASKGLDIAVQWLQKHASGAVDIDTALSSAQADMESQIGNPFDV
jgi:hypothetical protein